MRVENVYQDSEGNWHIDYDPAHLIGLAIRVYFGQFLIGLYLLLPLLILSALVGFTFNKPLPNENTSPSPDPQPESFCHKRERN